jgi:hypothetical protein
VNIITTTSSSSGCASVVAVLSHGLSADQGTLLGRADAAAAASLVWQALHRQVQLLLLMMMVLQRLLLLVLLLLMMLQRLLRVQWMVL